MTSNLSRRLFGLGEKVIQIEARPASEDRCPICFGGHPAQPGNQANICTEHDEDP